MNQALAGNRDAFAALIRQHHRLVAGVVSRTTSGQAEVDDLVQDVFLTAYERLGSLRRPDRFKSWLAQLARNRAHAWGRARKRERRAHSQLSARSAVPSTQGVSLKPNHQELLAALAELPPQTQRVVRLRYLEGLQATEIGARLDLTPVAVRQRLSRALKELRERLREEEK